MSMPYCSLISHIACNIYGLTIKTKTNKSQTDKIKIMAREANQRLNAEVRFLFE